MRTRYFHKGSLVVACRTSLSFPKRHICGVMKPLSPDTLFLLNFLFSHLLLFKKEDDGKAQKVYERIYGKVEKKIAWSSHIPK